MTWTELLQPRKNIIIGGLVALGIVMISGLIYAPGAMGSFVVWTLLGASAVIVLVILGQLLYAVVSLEKGYRSGVEASSKPRAPAPAAGDKQPFPVVARPPAFATRSTQFEEALADLRAAQYLLGKVQAGGAFREFSETQRRECDHALEEVRAVLGEVAREKSVQKFAS